MARWWLEAQTCIHILYKSCGEPSLLDQCAQYKFSTGRHPYDKNSPLQNFNRWTLAVLFAYFAWRRDVWPTLHWTTTVAFFRTQREPLMTSITGRAFVATVDKGEYIIPIQYYVPPPRIFRPCDGPIHMYYILETIKQKKTTVKFIYSKKATKFYEITLFFYIN